MAWKDLNQLIYKIFSKDIKCELWKEVISMAKCGGKKGGKKKGGKKKGCGGGR